jgi:hypothetical protein
VGTTRRAGPAAVALAIAVLAGCGGDSGGGGDDKAIEAALDKQFTSGVDAVECNGSFTDELVIAVYKSRKHCNEVEADDDDTDDTDSIDVSDIEVDGDRATATIVLHGGNSDGAKGSVKLRKQDDTWRIDGFGADFLKSSLRANIGSSDEFPDEAKGCITDGVIGVGSEAEFVDFAYGVAGENQEQLQQFLSIMNRCTGSDGGDDASVIRKAFEKESLKRLKEQGISDEIAQCIVEKLRDSVSDEDILAAQDAAGQKKIADATQVAVGQCG